MSKELQIKPVRAQASEEVLDGNGTGAAQPTPEDTMLEAAPVSGRRHAFYALTFRNFRLFFVGQLISVAGTWMQTVAQQWLVYTLTHSAGWLGIVTGAGAIPYVAFSLWGGQAADRYPRRTTLVWTQTFMMVLAFVLAVLATNRWIPIQAWHIALLAGLSGIVNAFNMPAQQAFVTDMVDEREALGNAIALNSLRFNLARVLGPVLAGIVLAKVGAAMCFTLNGVSFIAVIISLLMMRLPPFERHAQRFSSWEGFGYIWRTPSTLRIVLLVAVASLFAWPVSTLYPLFATHFHKGVQGFSAMMTANGIGAAVGGLALAALGDLFTSRQLVYGGAILFGVSLVLLACAPIYFLALVCLVLGGFAMIVFGTSSNTKVQEDVPDVLRGRVMAIYTLVFQAVMPLGSLEIGFLADRLNANRAVLCSATLCLVLTLALLAWSIADSRRRVARK